MQTCRDGIQLSSTSARLDRNIVMMLRLLILLLVLAKPISSENYNLFGSPGQGYIIQVQLGNPPQSLNVILDTGSSTLAVAAEPRNDVNDFFQYWQSKTIQKYNKEVSAKYTEGDWTAQLAADYVSFPSLQYPEIKTDIALIKKAHNFFMKGADWQGILGLAYPKAAAAGKNIIAQSYLEALDSETNHKNSFILKLCGIYGGLNTSHYGSFELIENMAPLIKDNKIYRTPVLREVWYEIAVLSVRILNKNDNTSTENIFIDDDKEITPLDHKNGVICRNLSRETSIVDSGTTNLRLPDYLFEKVVGELSTEARNAGILILDEFWFQGEAACWPEPHEWSLPSLAIDILNAGNDHQYFTLELSPKNYMRLVSARAEGDKDERVSEYCYKFGVESGWNIVLGVAALEGLKVTFNKKDKWIGFETTDCGPDVRITGPKNGSKSFLELCHYHKPEDVAGETIKVAQLAIAVVLTAAMTLVTYLLAPCLRAKCIASLRRVPTQISLSRASLVQENT